MRSARPVNRNLRAGISAGYAGGYPDRINEKGRNRGIPSLARPVLTLDEATTFQQSQREEERVSLSPTGGRIGPPRSTAPRSEWWLLGGCLVVLVLAAVSIYQLRRHARDSVQAEERLGQLQIAIAQLGALEWQAIAAGRLEPALAVHVRETRARMDSILEDLRRVPAAARTLSAIEIWHRGYADALDREFALIAAGRVDEARAREGEMTRRYETGAQALTAAAVTHARRARWTSELASVGSLAVFLVAAFGTAFLFRGRERIRQATRVARAEALAREQSEARFHALIQNALDAVVVVDVQGRIEYATPSAATVFSVSADNLAGTSITDWTDDDGAERLRRLLQECAASDVPPPPVEVRLRADDRRLVEAVATNRIRDPLLGGLVLTCRDVSERRRLESQLRQSQKMDAIGQLAGGIAHDFNNLLGVITGFTELLGRDLGPGHRSRARVDQIMKAAVRASDLTRQLLAFSRKQTLQPVVLDLNVLVLDMEPMLRRLIGEQIEVVALTTGTAASVMADKGQIEQVIMNLAVNARDAMPGGGRLLIETGEMDVDEEPLAARLGLPRGRYVTLAVSDTGTGMDRETTSRVFEPFFTTKEVGKGTGLGLATVYGIVTQSGGQVEVYSEREHGSTFRIYLPRAAGAGAEKPEPQEVPGPVAHHGKTVLLVEDDDALREFTLELLEEAGYTVIGAANGIEALALAAGRSAPLDAVVTDVVMPGMTGPEMVERLRAGGAAPKVLFISGYTHGAIGQQGVLVPGTHFLAKPFRAAALLDKLREIIDEGHPTAAA
jgi:two-component system cell cycle sensor histidine kinase/response regulator CckA